MDQWAKEAGQTVRAAMHSWPETARLCVLIVAAVAATWVYYHL